jgi:hypothetical protein
MANRSGVGTTALAYIQKYADRLSKRSIARMLAEDHPELYSTTEAARDMVRYYSGSRGRLSKTHSENDKLFFAPYPEAPVTDMFYDISQRRARILCLSDIQVVKNKRITEGKIL